MNIGFDIDGVLTDFEKFVIDYGSKYLHKIPKNYDGLEISEVFDVDRSVENLFWKEMIYEYATSYKSRSNSDKLFHKLKADGHKVYIITNRCTNLSYCDISIKEMKNLVKNWLDNEGIIYDEIIFNKTKSKLLTCQKLDIEVMVEDQLDHITELSPYLKTICFKSNYNKNSNLKNLIYVNDMIELYKIISCLK